MAHTHSAADFQHIFFSLYYRQVFIIIFPRKSPLGRPSAFLLSRKVKQQLIKLGTLLKSFTILLRSLFGRFGPMSEFLLNFDYIYDLHFTGHVSSRLGRWSLFARTKHARLAINIRFVDNIIQHLSIFS